MEKLIESLEQIEKGIYLFFLIYVQIKTEEIQPKLEKTLQEENETDLTYI